MSHTLPYWATPESYIARQLIKSLTLPDAIQSLHCQTQLSSHSLPHTLPTVLHYHQTTKVPTQIHRSPTLPHTHPVIHNYIEITKLLAFNTSNFVIHFTQSHNLFFFCHIPSFLSFSSTFFSSFLINLLLYLFLLFLFLFKTKLK